MFSVSFIIDMLIWLWLFSSVKNAGLNGSPEGLISSVICAFVLTVWPFPAFKPKPEDMNDKGV